MNGFERLAIHLLLFTLAVGCASTRSVVVDSTSPPTNVEAEAAPAERSYLGKRGRDFLQTFKFGVGYGLFVQADVEATILAHLGVGVAMNQLVGISNGEAKSWLDYVEGFPVTNIDGAMKGEWRRALCFHTHSPDFEFISFSEPTPVHTCLLSPLFLTLESTDDGNRFGMALSNDAFPPIRWADLEAGATVAPVAIRVGFSPGETVDFIAGWFGFDPAGDD